MTRMRRRETEAGGAASGSPPTPSARVPGPQRKGPTGGWVERGRRGLIAATGPARFKALATRDESGFTLIELIVVIIILGLVVGLVGPRIFGRIGQSKQAAAKAQIELLGAGLDQYRLDVGSYPSSGQGLDALVRNPGVADWNGSYLKKQAIPKDPWGNPYHYKCCPGDHGDYDIWSYGIDNAPGGDGESADVTSWDVK